MLLETIKPFRLKDIILLALLSLIFNILSLTINYFNLSVEFYLLLAIFYFLITLSLLLINKTGTVLIFCLMNILISNLFPTNNIYQTLAVFLILSLIFEIIFTLFKLEFKSIQLDLIFGASFSSAAIPWIILYFSNAELTTALITNTLNLSIINFLIGVIGASIASLLWHELRKSKLIIRFEYE
ncbi:MAG: hypothetical protein AABX39_00835 [Nanoarchaeota archaeon]